MLAKVCRRYVNSLRVAKLYAINLRRVVVAAAKLRRKSHRHSANGTLSCVQWAMQFPLLKAIDEALALLENSTGRITESTR